MTTDRGKQMALLILLVILAGLPLSIPATAHTPIAAGESVLSHYSLQLIFNPGESTIGGRAEIKYQNLTGESQSAIPMRLYPNAFYYGDGQTTVTIVKVDGEAAETTIDESRTVLKVSLPEPLQPDDTNTISVDFATVIPPDSDGSYGILSHDTTHETWALADFYPIVAGWDSVRGWVTDTPTSRGDPTFADAASYDVTVSAPAEIEFFATGDGQSTNNPEGHRTWRFTSDLAREFTMVADAQPRSIRTTGEGVTVHTHLTGATDDSRVTAARAIRDWAVESIAANEARYGEYPYDELEIVEVDLESGVQGVSWAGLIFIDTEIFDRYVEKPNVRQSIRITIAHEVGHQWWGNLVGGNTNDHAFFIEGLTHYLAMVAVADAWPLIEEKTLVESHLAAGYLSMLDEQGDAVVDLPSTLMPVDSSYSQLIYLKAGLGFLAMRLAAGNEAFFAALAQFAQEFAWRNAQPADLLELLETSSARELDATWQLWFASANVTAADVEALLSKS